MPEVDQELAAHCLEDLGTVTRGCKIVGELSHVRSPLEACDGWSIRDQLFGFLKQAIVEADINSDSRKEKRVRRYENASGQIAALSYAVALMDNPYRPDPSAVTAAARMEVDGSSE